jgi:hypothetical protein
MFRSPHCVGVAVLAVWELNVDPEALVALQQPMAGQCEAGIWLLKAHLDIFDAESSRYVAT